MNFVNTASRAQLHCYFFGQDAVAADQTDVQLPVAIGEASQAVDGYVMPWPFDVVAICGTLSAAGSAGALDIGPTINGTEQTNGTVQVTTGTSFRQLILRESIRGLAGDILGAEITTNSAWDNTSGDLAVQVYVLFRVDGV